MTSWVIALKFIVKMNQSRYSHGFFGGGGGGGVCFFCGFFFCCFVFLKRLEGERTLF